MEKKRKKKRPVRRILQVSGLSACVLVLLACIISVLAGFMYRGASRSIVLTQGLIGYIAYHGTPEDILKYKNVEEPHATPGWQCFPVAFDLADFFRKPVRESWEVTRTNFLVWLFGVEDNRLSDKVVIVRYWLPLGWPLLASLLLTGLMFLPGFSRRDKSLLCKKCGYNLTGNESGICPECGTPVPEPVKAKLAVKAQSERTSQHV